MDCLDRISDGLDACATVIEADPPLYICSFLRFDGYVSLILC